MAASCKPTHHFDQLRPHIDRKPRLVFTSTRDLYLGLHLLFQLLRVKGPLASNCATHAHYRALFVPPRFDNPISRFLLGQFSRLPLEIDELALAIRLSTLIASTSVNWGFNSGFTLSRLTKINCQSFVRTAGKSDFLSFLEEEGVVTAVFCFPKLKP